MTTCDQTKPKVARVVCSSQSEAGQTNMNRNTGGLLGCGPGELVHSRDKLYRLIISQLFYDGYQQVAVTLTNMVHADPPCPPSDRLSHVVTLGMDKETEPGHRNLNKSEQELGPGLDLEYETEMTSSAPEPATYETAYVTSHKGNCRSGAFSADGQLCATGSVDASIKILDVDRMLAKSNPEGRGGMDQTGHPVIRTLYDHLEVRDQISVSVLLFKHFVSDILCIIITKERKVILGCSSQEVTVLEFHPKEPILASGSLDFTVKLFDYSKASAKKAFKTITDVAPITCMSFHPTGDYLGEG